MDGNKKGIFTRERQPKMVAHAIRQRYMKLRQIKNESQTTSNILSDEL